MKIEISFDDGSVYDIKTVALLNRYRLKATFYIPVNWQKYLATKRIDALTYDEVMDIAKTHTIGAHGVNHELLTRVSKDKQINEIFLPIKWWREQGIEVTSFCYARGYYTQEIKDLVKRAGYKDARTVKVGELTNQDPYETHVTVHLGLDRAEYGTDWLTYAKSKFLEGYERSESENIIFRAFGHSEEIHRLQQWERFEGFLRFIHENTHS